MPKFPLYLLIPFLVSFISFFYVSHALYQVYVYLSCDQKTQAQIHAITIREYKENDYRAQLSLYGIVKGKKRFFEHDMKKKLPNLWAAESYKNTLSQKSFLIWYQKGHPERYIINKEFPLKSCVYAFILIALSFYFHALFAYKKNEI